MKLITVLMPVYNTKEEWLRLAIESILSQSYKNIEFLIVTDGPTDNSCDVIDDYARQDGRIRVVRNESNIGLIKTLNKGLSLARGEYIARMDSDDIALPKRLELELKHLSDNSLDLVGGRLQKIDEFGNNIGIPTMVYTDKQVEKVIKYTDCIPHPTWLGKKIVFDKLGGYREIKYCEDYDLLLRAYKNGIKLGMCNDVVLNYRINNAGITRSNSLRQFLTSDYLRNHINGIEQVNQNMIDEHIDKKVDQSKADKFERSIEYFRDGVNAAKDKSFLKAIRYMIKGLGSSRYAFKNFYYIAKSNIAMKGLQ